MDTIIEHTRYSRQMIVLFVFLFALEICPIWFFTFFPSHDGPSHVHNAYVLKTFFTGTPPRIAEYYKLNAFPFPNWSSHPFMGTLMLVVSPETAHKILLTVILTLFPISIFYFLESVTKRKSIYVIVGFLFNYHFMLHYGFYNFSLSAPFYFFSLGYYWKHKERFTVRNTVILTTLLLATYFCHMITFTILMCSLTLLVITTQYRKPARLLIHLAGVAPFLVVMVAFILQFSYGEPRAYFAKKHWLRYFFDIGSLVYYTDAHFFITRPLVLVGFVVFFITVFQIIFKKNRPNRGGIFWQLLFFWHPFILSSPGSLQAACY
ncbi:MAG: hypothetical protein N3B18_08580 [Desulfobacterota bacterium]|nr:hypothetical protein [Thermodesulfobacteriota bacterium]